MKHRRSIVPIPYESSPSVLLAADDQKEGIGSSEPFFRLRFRSNGPGFPPERILDPAVHTDDRDTEHAGAPSGNVWKTTSRTTAYQPIFDEYGARSIAGAGIDPGSSLNARPCAGIGTIESGWRKRERYAPRARASTEG